MTCRVCGKHSYSEYCLAHKPRKRIITNKRPKQIGPVTRKWLETRNEWMQQHPGPWNCYICGVALPNYLVLTLDHIKSRSRYPELRFVLSNLAPCCASCNKRKGSKNIEEMEDIWREDAS
jgi:5-methylcytosine-specific restriction endonuclease McrA